MKRTGRVLCQQAERRLVEQGLKEVTLWVLKDNRLAHQFYF
ncbi:MAG TPA: GNAT family N-acetyltransferase [Terracidiphilus sp.]|jgi:hypothetical protein